MTEINMSVEERNKEVQRLEIALSEIEQERYKIIKALEKLNWSGWQELE
jgi:hypothetical protein